MRKSRSDTHKTGNTPPEAGRKPGPEEAGRGGREETETPPKPDPTRYGDWEIDGRCIDF